MRLSITSGKIPWFSHLLPRSKARNYTHSYHPSTNGRELAYQTSSVLLILSFMVKLLPCDFVSSAKVRRDIVHKALSTAQEAWQFRLYLDWQNHNKHPNKHPRSHMHVLASMMPADIFVAFGAAARSWSDGSEPGEVASIACQVPMPDRLDIHVCMNTWMGSIWFYRPRWGAESVHDRVWQWEMLRS